MCNKPLVWTVILLSLEGCLQPGVVALWKWMQEDQEWLFWGEDSFVESASPTGMRT